MATHINNKTISSPYSTPTIKYDITYTAKRNSNSQVTYTFKVTPWMDGNTSETWFGTGYGLKGSITVNGVTATQTLKETSENWRNTTADMKRTTKTFTITCASTSANTQQTVTFKVWQSGTLIGTSGNVNTSDYYVLSPELLPTACTAPTSVTASPDNFDSSATIKWSGAKGGIHNPITAYCIGYYLSADNQNWTWYYLADPVTSDESGTYTYDMSSVPRGYYIKFGIQTRPNDSNYYSNWVYSNVIRRKPYTQCTAPTTFTVSPNNFESIVKFSWSGASGGTNNAVSSYYIEYSTSANGVIWSSWTTLQTVATTKTSYSLEIDISSKVGRGDYVKFQIRTQGSAGSSYYSGFKSSSSLRRNPYSACTAPKSVTVKSEKDINNIEHTDIFKNTITLSWSGATKGENNAITGYDIDYCISENQTSWSDWSDLQETASTATVLTVNISSKVSRGNYVKFRIRTMGQQGVDYYSAYVESNAIKRNSLPTIDKFEVVSPITLEYSFGDSIELQWNKAVDVDNNLNNYEINVRYTQDDVWTSWYALNSSVSSSTIKYIFAKSNTIYQSILNNQQVQFRIRAKDIFGEYSSYSTSDIVARYDITGISIEMDGKWRSCQLYYLPTSTKVTTTKILTTNSNWEYGNLNNTTGAEMQPANEDDYSHIRTDYLQPLGITIFQDDYYTYDVQCTFFYYDENYNFITKSTTQILKKSNISSPKIANYIFPDESYDYVRIVLYSSPENIDGDGIELKNCVVIERATSATNEWIEYEAMVAIDGEWTELYDGK